MLSRRFAFLIFCLAWLLPLSASSSGFPTSDKDKDCDKDKDRDTYVEKSLPMPDALPPVLPSASAVRFLAEYRMPTGTYLPTGLTGIDVSHYQGIIDWAEVASDPSVRFAYVKATEASSLRDSYMQRNLKGARSVRIPVGVYHFFSPTASVEEQLSNFLGNVKPQEMDLIPIIDVEKRGRSSIQVFNSRLQKFLLQVENAYGVKPIIYTYMNFYNRYMVGLYGQYNFMIASYSEDVPQLIDNPKMILWQFTSEGKVQGVRTHVDRSRFMGDHGLKDILLHR